MISFNFPRFSWSTLELSFSSKRLLVETKRANLWIFIVNLVHKWTSWYRLLLHSNSKTTSKHTPQVQKRNDWGETVLCLVPSWSSNVFGIQHVIDLHTTAVKILCIPHKIHMSAMKPKDFFLLAEILLTHRNQVLWLPLIVLCRIDLRMVSKILH